MLKNLLNQKNNDFTNRHLAENSLKKSANTLIYNINKNMFGPWLIKSISFKWCINFKMLLNKFVHWWNYRRWRTRMSWVGMVELWVSNFDADVRCINCSWSIYILPYPTNDHNWFMSRFRYFIHVEYGSLGFLVYKIQNQWLFWCSA